jgi:6-phosphogluconolactonase (cycloisomerase 2 family)
VSPDGKSVYVATEASDAVVILKLNRHTGALTPKGCVEDNDSGLGVCAKSANGLNGVTSTAVSPNGKSLYAVSEGDDAVVRFKRNRHTGALTPKDCIDDNDFGTDPDQGEDTCGRSVNGLYGLSAVAVSPDGRSVYAGSEFDSAVVRFKRNTDTGRLKAAGCIDDNDVADDTCADTTNGLESLETLVLTRDGKSLYADSVGDGAIVRFNRDTTTGALKAKGCVSDNDETGDNCALKVNGLGTPALLAVSRDGKSLYATAEEDDAIVRFKRAR